MVPGPRLRPFVVGLFYYSYLAATGRAPHADDRPTAHRIRRARAMPRQLRDWDLESDRVDVQRFGRVDPGRRSTGDQMQVLKRPQVAEVEDRAQVDIEPVGPLAGEDPAPARQDVDGRLAERGVVGRRPRPDIARRAGK